MKKSAIILLASIACLAGCDSKTKSSDGNLPEPQGPGCFVSTNIVDIKENIRQMCDALARTGASREYIDLSKNLHRSITNITDAATAVMACDAWLDALFEVDISRFSYREQSVLDEQIGHITDNMFDYMKSIKLSREEWRELWFVKKFEYTIKYLRWKRRLLNRLRPRRKLAKELTPADDGEDAYEDWLKWRHLYYDGICDYEYRLRNIEHMLPYWAREIPTNTVRRITMMLEDHIGRPIRTGEQYREDHRLMRFVEFTEKFDPLAAP